MEEGKGKSTSSLFFVLLVLSCLFLMELLYFDFSTASPDHPHEIRLIYDKPLMPMVESDSSKEEYFIAEYESDSIVYEEMDTTVVASDSIFFINMANAAFGVKKKNLPVIRYYTKQNDDKKVYELRKYGYYIHERESSELGGYMSNSICYGDSVANDDILLIAYILISQGIKIKDISQSKYHNDWKFHSIEIGTDTTVTNNSAITLSDLRNMWADN